MKTDEHAIFPFPGQSYAEHFYPSHLMFKIITSTQTCIHQGPLAERGRGALTTPLGRVTPFTSKLIELDICHSKHWPQMEKEFGTVYVPQTN
jgi:hypothetical protein